MRVAVVGGGITGLAAAHRLMERAQQGPHASPVQFVLFEKQPALGGVVGSVEHAGYLLEKGADSFITNKPWAVDLCKRLGLEERLIPTDAQYRRSLVLCDKKPVQVPEGFQLLAPTQLLPFLSTPILSWKGKLRALAELFISKKKNSGDESLADFVRRRFGKEALDRLVQPLVGGIYTSDPERLSIRATLERFVDLEAKYGSVIWGLLRDRGGSNDAKASGARYGLFATLRGGIGELVSTLATKVATGVEVRTGVGVTNIVPGDKGHGCTLLDTSGQRHTFDGLILATPAYRAAELVRAWLPKVAENLQAIEYASTAIVVSGYKLSDIAHPLDAFGLVIPARENRKILAVSFTSRKFPGRAPTGCVQLRTFVGGAMQPELMKLSDAGIQQLVRQELRDLLGVKGEPQVEIVARWERAMPQYHLGHLERVGAIEQGVAGVPWLALAGNAYRGVGLPDVIHSGEQAADRLWQHLSNRRP